MNEEVSPARYKTRSPTSSAFPSLLKGVEEATFVLTSALVNVSWKVVLIIPGETQFTLIPLGPNSFARPLV